MSKSVADSSIYDGEDRNNEKRNQVSDRLHEYLLFFLIDRSRLGRCVRMNFRRNGGQLIYTTIAWQYWDLKSKEDFQFGKASFETGFVYRYHKQDKYC